MEEKEGVGEGVEEREEEEREAERVWCPCARPAPAAWSGPVSATNMSARWGVHAECIFRGGFRKGAVRSTVPPSRVESDV